jgi:serine/threonine protein kinase
MAGYLQNDLKLENILVGRAMHLPENLRQLHKLKIIDFGLCTRYRDANGQHYPKT